MGGFAFVIQHDEEEPEAAEILVDGSVGGRPYRFLLDTGAANWLMDFPRRRWAIPKRLG